MPPHPVQSRGPRRCFGEANGGKQKGNAPAPSCSPWELGCPSEQSSLLTCLLGGTLGKSSALHRRPLGTTSLPLSAKPVPQEGGAASLPRTPPKAARSSVCKASSPAAVPCQPEAAGLFCWSCYETCLGLGLPASLSGCGHNSLSLSRQARPGPALGDRAAGHRCTAKRLPSAPS